MGPEDNPADDVPADKDEWEEWQRRQDEYAERERSEKEEEQGR